MDWLRSGGGTRCQLAFGLGVAAVPLAAVLGLGATVHLITRSRIVSLERAPHTPVALVLGAEVFADGTPSAFLRARLDLAAALYRRGLVERLLLSGDSSPMVARVATELGIDEARGGLRPNDKLAVLQQLREQGHRVLMLGDGVNDVPVLAAADISVAMGSATDLAKTSADAVLLSNRLEALSAAFAMARRTRRIIIENLLWAGLYNGLMLPFAALGWITPAWAAIGMSVSSLTVVLNALRLTKP